MLGDIISAADLLLKFRSSRAREDERVSHYVTVIADDAEELARIWTALLNSLLDNKVLSKRDRKDIILFDQGSLQRLGNAAPVSRLRVFYERLHYVLGTNYSGKADLLIEKLANLLSYRDLTRERVSSELGVARWTPDEIEAAILTINRQAAEIRIFAEELRARPR